MNTDHTLVFDPMNKIGIVAPVLVKGNSRLGKIVLLADGDWECRLSSSELLLLIGELPQGFSYTIVGDNEAWNELFLTLVMNQKNASETHERLEEAMLALSREMPMQPFLESLKELAMVIPKKAPEYYFAEEELNKTWQPVVINSPLRRTHIAKRRIYKPQHR